MNACFRLIICLLVCSSVLACVQPQDARAQKGVLDLREFPGLVRLSGQWHYAPELIEPRSRGSFTPIEIPDDNDLHRAGQNRGCATFRLKLLLPESGQLGLVALGQEASYRLFWNGQQVAQSGKPDCEAASYEPSSRPAAAFVSARSESEVVLQIANFDNYEMSAGRILLGSEDMIHAFLVQRISLEVAVGTGLGMILLYQLALFALRRRETSHLFSALLCAAGLTHHLVSGSHLLPLYVSMPYRIMLKAEYISWIMSAPVFVHLLSVSLRLSVPKWIIPALYGISGVLCLAVLVLSPALFTQALAFLQIAFLLQCGYALYLLLDSLRRGREGSALLLGGALILFVAVINDGLNSRDLLDTTSLSSMGLLIFLAVDGLVTARGLAEAYVAVEDLTVRLIDTNQAYTRFMPAEFLGYMEKDSITDVKLGDHIQKEMTVLFADIRDFTAMSEKISPAENFEFLNGYLSRVGPIIRNHNGFIDKFIGDAVMALFPGGADDAVKSAIDMQREIAGYNIERKEKGREAVRVGIGIHTGSLIMGIIGENERMEGTVISDVVNVASRIENLTKIYRSSILISGETLVNLEDALDYHFRLLGRVPVKGKSRPVSVVEIIDARSDMDVMLATKVEFEKGFNALMIGHTQDAIRCFEFVLSKNPNDGAAQLYLAKLKGSEDPETAVYVPSL